MTYPEQLDAVLDVLDSWFGFVPHMSADATPETISRNACARSILSQLGIDDPEPMDPEFAEVFEAAQLRKDKPHPVAPLPACPQLAQHGVDNRLLRRYKALEIEPIGHLKDPP